MRAAAAHWGMTPDRYPHLAQFFGGYFHQDWRAEFSDESAAVAAFLAGVPGGEALRAQRELARLLRSVRGEAGLAEVCAALGCEHLPDRGWRRWLSSVERQLAAADAG